MNFEDEALLPKGGFINSHIENYQCYVSALWFLNGIKESGGSSRGNDKHSTENLRLKSGNSVNVFIRRSDKRMGKYT